jgi:hypothetical protein
MEGKPIRLFPLVVMLVLVVGIIVYLRYKG